MNEPPDVGSIDLTLVFLVLLGAVIVFLAALAYYRSREHEKKGRS